MTKRYRKIDSAYEPQCDADGCEAIAVMTDGEMNWCEEHQPKRGGARPGAGRKPDPSRFDERSYQAGYHAGLRAGQKQ